MAVAFEKIEEALADFAAFHGEIGKVTLNIFLTAKAQRAQRFLPGNFRAFLCVLCVFAVNSHLILSARIE
jgi:hypothetical protein